MKHPFYNFILCFSLAFGLSGCSQAQSPMTVRPLNMLAMTDTIANGMGDTTVARNEGFVITNFRYGADATKFLDEWAKSHVPSNMKGYGQYTMTFYKESEYTNEKNLKENPHDLDRHSNGEDLVYQYHWTNGALSMRMIFKDGEMIDPKSKITITDLPQRPSH